MSEKCCPKCNSIVEGQNVSSNGFFLTYICDECGFDLADIKKIKKLIPKKKDSNNNIVHALQCKEIKGLTKNHFKKGDFELGYNKAIEEINKKLFG